MRKTRTIHTFFFLFQICSMPLYLTRYGGSNLALLHRVKETKTPSLSAQASFASFSLKVAWSGKSLINRPTYRNIFSPQQNKEILQSKPFFSAECPPPLPTFTPLAHPDADTPEAPSVVVLTLSPRP